MADLLLYASIVAQDKLYGTGSAAGAVNPSYDLSGSNSSDSSGIVSSYPIESGDAASIWRSTMISEWRTNIDPYTTPKANSLCCFDTSGNYRCGNAFAWTVPANTSRITVQMWGAGGGSGAMCCCGMSPPGRNGSYVVAQIDVCPGEVFCFCRGCAYCCCATNTTIGAPGGVCGSFMCYCGNPNGGDVAGGSSSVFKLCAPGADLSCVCQWNCRTCQTFSGYTTACNNNLPSIKAGQSTSVGAELTTLSADLCNECSIMECGNGWHYCWDTGADDAYMPPIYGCRIPSITGAIEQVTNKNMVIRGIPTIYPEVAIGASMQDSGFSQPAPVYGFTKQQDGTDPLQNGYIPFTGSTCNGHCFNVQASGMCVPGMGAVGSSVYGGCNACPGGTGRAGLICISWDTD